MQSSHTELQHLVHGKEIVISTVKAQKKENARAPLGQFGGSGIYSWHMGSQYKSAIAVMRKLFLNLVVRSSFYTLCLMGEGRSDKDQGDQVLDSFGCFPEALWSIYGVDGGERQVDMIDLDLIFLGSLVHQLTIVAVIICFLFTQLCSCHRQLHPNGWVDGQHRLQGWRANFWATSPYRTLWHCPWLEVKAHHLRCLWVIQRGPCRGLRYSHSWT